MADANHDGRVTLAEATSGALHHFDLIDANRDGRLTPEERAPAAPMMQQMRKPRLSRPPAEGPSEVLAMPPEGCALRLRRAFFRAGFAPHSEE